MKWQTLFNKIGKQPIRITRNEDVFVLIDGKEIKIEGIKFKKNGSPYLYIQQLIEAETKINTNEKEN